MINIATEYRDSLRNLRRAKRWLNRAAEAGDSEAKLELAETYYRFGQLRNKRKINKTLMSALSGGDFLSEQSQDRIKDILGELDQQG